MAEQEKFGPENWVVSPNLHDDGVIHLDLISPYPPELIELLKKQVEGSLVPMELRFHTTTLCAAQMMIDAEALELIFEFDEHYTLLTCSLEAGHEEDRHEDAETGIGWRHLNKEYSTLELPKRELVPHNYWPDFRVMGDCSICGHAAESTIHNVRKDI